MQRKTSKSSILPDSVGRYRLSEDEEQLLLKYREQKTLLQKECEEAGIDINSVKQYWYKSKMFSIFAKPKEKTLQDLKGELLKDMQKHSPKYTPIKRKKINDAHCLVINLCDLHIGKLASEFETGESYNSKIAINNAMKAVNDILNRAANFNFDKIVLIIGNDILHTDTPRGTTTSGTPQDSHGMWYDNFLLAKSLYVDIIESLMQISDVHVIHNVSNHDYMSGWYLSETIKSWFRLSKNVTFDNNMRHRKAFVYHKNLIGTTHGDGAKVHDLPLLMAQEFREQWSNTNHRYIYTAHIHHKQAKDYIGVTVESGRSLSGTDGWHHRNGYQHAPKGLDAYVHHPTEGQIARISKII